ncbi:ABC transporter ATP-binding protein [Paenibacillus sp. y28]|uniref:ABC transporter ATP-binding protein n=1 Tax=Paenibacillus sp. y28 TaxID=3129110 RepID=UPI00301A03D0
MIRVEGLSKTFRGGWLNRSRTEAVQDVSFAIPEGRTLGLVGESGCGKSTLSRLVLKLIPADAGKIWFGGQDITAYTTAQLRPLRPQLQLIFQHPDAALHPRMTMLQSLIEPLLLHRLADKEAGTELAAALLEQVGLSTDILHRYPHQVSGGQIQRVVIARALTMNPKLLVLDEPTSMLDVSVQAQVMEVLKQIQRQRGISFLLISHDMELVRHFSQQTAVMHQGRIVELGSSEAIMEAPKHAYTKRLVRAFRAYPLEANK